MRLRSGLIVAVALLVALPTTVAVAAPPATDQATSGTDRATSGTDKATSTPEVAGTAAANGHLPPSALRPVAGVSLAPHAAVAFERMLAAAARDGAVLAVTDGYRSYDRQVDLKQRKGWLAARPGTSQHGWGVAVDFDTGVTDFAWLREHAAAYGWIHPTWAQPGGSKPEPWHWEYVGGQVGHGGPDGLVAPGPTATPRAIGDLVATARFEPVYGRTGEWFIIHEGLEDLDAGPRHYAGTSDPGAEGNFAIAGFQRSHGAPLAGIDLLWAGDQIRVRTADGGEDVYRVMERRELTDQDGWAVGDDPLETGTSHVMTVTTAAPDGGLSVVWADLVTD